MKKLSKYNAQLEAVGRSRFYLNAGFKSLPVEPKSIQNIQLIFELLRTFDTFYEILGKRHYGFGDGALDHPAGYILGLRSRYLPGTYRKVFHKNPLAKS